MQEAALWPEEDFQAAADEAVGALGRPGITKKTLRGASSGILQPSKPQEILRGASGGLLQPTLSCCRAERLQSINQQYPNYPKIFPSPAELSSPLQQIHFLGWHDSSLMVPNPTEPQTAQNEEFVRIQQETQPHSPAGSSRGCREEVSLEEAA